MKPIYLVTVLSLLAANPAGYSLDILSRPEGGGEANNRSDTALKISRDGRYLAFYSVATNLVPNDTNGRGDIFVADRSTGNVELVSVSTSEVQHTGSVGSFDISGNGRYVAFSCSDDALVANDSNGESDILIRDLQEGTTELVSVRTNGAQGNGASVAPSVSYDGRYVAFVSYATNLVNSDGNGVHDVFVRDRLSGITTIESVNTTGQEANDYSQNPSISDDGSKLAFESPATDIIANDTNGQFDVFVRDRIAGMTEAASVNSSEVLSAGGAVFPVLSGDGTCVAFFGVADDLDDTDMNGIFDIFVRDMEAGTTEIVSVGNNGEVNGTTTIMGTTISDDGRFAGFQTTSALDSDDMNSDQDVFIRDRKEKTTTRFSVADDGSDANDLAELLAISGDGKVAGFISEASNLAPPDFNGYKDVFAGVTPFGIREAAQRVALSKRIGKFKKKAKILKKKGKKTAAKRLLKKAKKLTQQLRLV